MRVRSASASASGVGNRCCVPRRESAGRASPNACASRAVKVRAAATLTCWPMTARMAISKPSQPLGRRSPGRFFSSGRRRGSLRQRRGDRMRVGIQVEHAAQPVDDIQQARRRDAAQFQLQGMLAARPCADPQPARRRAGPMTRA